MSNTIENFAPQTSITAADGDSAKDEVSAAMDSQSGTKRDRDDDEAASGKLAKVADETIDETVDGIKLSLMTRTDNNVKAITLRAQKYFENQAELIRKGEDNQTNTAIKLTAAVVKLTDVKGDPLTSHERLFACRDGAQSVLEKHLPERDAAMNEKMKEMTKLKEAISHVQSRLATYMRKVEAADLADVKAQILEVLYMSLTSAIQVKLAASEEVAEVLDKLESVESERDQEREKLKEFTSMVTAFVTNMAGKVD